MYRVADFFCGGGGFSEGFKLAGFKVIFAVDKWQPAITTHHANHPNAKTVLDDVIRISNLSDEDFHKLVPDTEVIIGSPPCTFFSNSNKSGKGDKSLGIELIEAYLRIVARKKIKKNSILKNWVLENVPNVELHIKSVYTYRELGVEADGELQVKYPSSKVYNAKYFGVASNRKRYFCGNFPEPEVTVKEDKDIRTVRDILNIIKKPKYNLEEDIQDPNYKDYQMLSKQVTDHHYIMEVAEFEWEKAKRLKEDRGYMGKMSFPENLDKPSRTVMATMSCSARESMIYPYVPEENRYRLPTVREIASVMSYPLDYRFFGKSKGIKYKLVGNSVPPKMSNAIAVSIAKEHGIRISRKYHPIQFNDNANDIFENLNLNIYPLNIEKPKRETAKFKYHIPYLIINTYRVELTNYNSDFDKLNLKWDVEIHKSQGKNAKVLLPTIQWEEISKKDREILKKFINDMCLKLDCANKFQKYYCMTSEERKQRNLVGPYELLSEIRTFIDDKLDSDDQRTILYNTERFPYPIYIGYIVLKKLIMHINKKVLS